MLSHTSGQATWLSKQGPHVLQGLTRRCPIPCPPPTEPEWWQSHNPPRKCLGKRRPTEHHVQRLAPLIQKLHNVRKRECLTVVPQSIRSTQHEMQPDGDGIGPGLPYMCLAAALCPCQVSTPRWRRKTRPVTGVVPMNGLPRFPLPRKFATGAGPGPAMLPRSCPAPFEHGMLMRALSVDFATGQ